MNHEHYSFVVPDSESTSRILLPEIEGIGLEMKIAPNNTNTHKQKSLSRTSQDRLQQSPISVTKHQHPQQKMTCYKPVNEENGKLSLVEPIPTTKYNKTIIQCSWWDSNPQTLAKYQ